MLVVLRGNVYAEKSDLGTRLQMQQFRHGEDSPPGTVFANTTRINILGK